MTKPPKISSEGVIRRNRRWLALGAAPWMIGVGVMMLGILVGAPQVLIGLPHLLILGTVGLAWAYKANRDPRLEKGELSSGDHGITLDGRPIASREELTQGFVVPHVEGTRLRLARRGLSLPLTLQVEDPDDGRAILRSLGLDSTQTAAELRAASWLFTQSTAKQMLLVLAPIFGVFLPSFLGLTAVGRTALPLGALLVLALVTYVFGLTMTPTRVRIGADGILTRWLFKHRFIPYADIDSCTAYDERMGNKEYLGVALTLVDGTQVKIPSGQKGWNDEDRTLLERRIGEALSNHRNRAHGVGIAALTRRGRTALDWVRELKRIGAGANADLRTAPVPLDALLRVVADTSETAARRAGAAIAVLPHVGEDERRALRNAVETTAEPKLRIALDKVIREDATDEQMAEALSELETDGAKAAPRIHA